MTTISHVLNYALLALMAVYFVMQMYWVVRERIEDRREDQASSSEPPSRY